MGQKFDENTELPGTLNGMFFQHYRFEPTSSIGAEDIANVLALCKVIVTEEILNKMSPALKSCFVKESDRYILKSKGMNLATVVELVTILDMKLGNAKVYERLPEVCRRHFHLDEVYNFKAQADISAFELACIVQIIDIKFSPTSFDVLPENTRRHFVSLNRYGQIHRYGAVRR